MHSTRTRLAVYSFAHFLVDLCCALLLFRLAQGVFDASFFFLVYNYCAFALQMPLGLLADKLSRNALIAAAGCALVAASFALYSLPMAAVIVAGLGNALFHVGGGVDVLDDSGSKAGALGVYVSPGALGLFVGTMLGKGDFPLAGGAGMMLAALAAILLMARHTGVLRASHNAPLSLRGTARFDVLLPALCLFLVVVIRSYAGMTMRFEWKSSGNWALFTTLAVMLGKCAGGFAMDVLGARAASLLSLLAAAVLFFFADNPYAGVAAVFLFNMTMPVTLWALAQRMPGCKGFSFGLLTFALFLGFAPVGLGWSAASANWLLAALCVLSALLMLPGVKGRPHRAQVQRHV